ncbi:PAS domain S-box protein [Herbaspirillum sp. RTI4]|uniref:PAS domain S-box protein n=1 Tax=Herbaspirillum sp. RTI4 TaxID=3048640 RepID=UPI002AB5C69A|nr:PAS domain S-box protein [Herbaspirillum sp. RTI4]MDY7578790.1 PAS domain S-box protein [Herbaspirillum sp. RTI4]MEA9982289.1 PAS domain S-box protein [Herbaspirillum sp. RTI4]
MKLRFKIWATLGLAVALLGTSIAFGFRTYQQVAVTAEARQHVTTVIAAADDFLSTLKDAETGQRGYLLTGNETFLAPYLVARDNIHTQLQSLQQQTSVAAAKPLVAALTPMLQAKMAELAQTIALERAHKHADMLTLVNSGKGKDQMNAIRTLLHELAQIEDSALAEREAEFQKTMASLFAIIVAASVFGLLTALVFARLIYRQGLLQLSQQALEETQYFLEQQEISNQQLQRSNTALQISEEQLSVTLHSIGDGVITTDAQARVTSLNPLAERLTGWSNGAARGHVISDVLHIVNKTSRQPVAIPVMAALLDGSVQALANHTVLLSKDGSEYDIADSCAPIRARDGEVIGAVLVFRDVTEEYVVQQAQRDSSALIQTVLNTVAEGILTVQGEGMRLTMLNPQVESMFGYEAAELLDKDIRVLIPAFDEIQPDIDRTADQQQPHPTRQEAVFSAYEVTGRRKDGSTFALEIVLSKMHLAGELHYTGILRDISARKRAEEALRDQQFYTRSLIEANIDAMMTTDPAGIITDVNKQMESLTGRTRDELIGSPFKQCFTDPERAEAGIKLVLHQKSVSDYELTARTRDGRETVVSYNATTFYDRENKLLGVFAAARDVTERKRLDRVLEDKNEELEAARAEADKASLAKSDFLSSMSHELRSPLNAILGFAQLMESESPAPTTGQQESIEQILRAGWHLLKLINEILDLTKIESRQIALSKEAVQLTEILTECQRMCEPQAQQRGIAMRFPAQDTVLHVLADHTRLSQVLINLVTNAIKYNRSEGSVEVSYTLQPQRRVRILIKDSGLGLRPDQLAQLFQAFNRLGQEASGVEGTGIGLVVAKQLIELMGGTIGVESTVGVGSVFWFELAIVDAPMLALDGLNAVPNPSPALTATKMRTLLYVEDNPANMKLMQKLIERRPEICLLMAGDGSTGIELAKAALPDVILLDINLPGISGLEVLKLLREDPLTADIPALAISANAMASDVRRGQEAGFLRYLTKPIKVDEFLLALDAALEVSERKKS